jgi:uncharacterized protein YkwD
MSEQRVTARALAWIARKPWWAMATVVPGIAIVALIATFSTSDQDLGAQVRPVARTPQTNAFRSLDPDRLTHGVVRLDFALQPTYTPTPVPTATPVPQPPPPEPVPPVLVEAPAPAPAARPLEPEGCAASMGGRARTLFNGMNVQRSIAGLPPLASDPCVTYVARTQAEAMASAGVLSHETGGDAFSILRSEGVGFGWAGENIAMNSYQGGQSVWVAMQGFMDSAGHRDNILSPNFSSAGVAAASAGGVTYYAVVFVG